MTAYESIKQRFEDATEHHLVKKTGAVLFHVFLGVLALIMTVMICGYIIYTLNFIVPPYFRFMNAHGPFSFLLLLLVWAAALFKYLTLSPEADEALAFKWDFYMYVLSAFLTFTGVGAFVVIPLVHHIQ